MVSPSQVHVCRCVTSGVVGCLMVTLVTTLAPAAVPATVSGTPHETDLVTVTLIPEAQQRLAIKTAPVKESDYRLWRSYSGVVTLASDANGPGGPVMPLEHWTSEAMLLLADRQIQADGEISKARVDLDYARTTL